jgi:hypothetical protein
MKRLLYLTCMMLWICNAGISQKSESAHTLQSLEEEFNKAKAVAYVRIKSFKEVQDLGGFYLYRISPRVEESIKGGHSKGQVIQYYARALDAAHVRKEAQIIFVKEQRYKEDKMEYFESKNIRGELLSDALAELRRLSSSRN